MKIIKSEEFDLYWKSRAYQEDDEAVETVVKEIIAAVSRDGDTAVRGFASKFDKSSPQQLEVPMQVVKQAVVELRRNDPELASSMELSADHIKRFSMKQRAQFSDFECEMEEGLFTGQRVIPVDRAAVYVPGGRFPLFSSVLMGMIPAFCAGVEEIILASPPLEDGLPDRKILAAAAIAAESFAGGLAGDSSGACNGRMRVFAVGGAQAIAGLALGTQTIPRVDLIVGPGNKYVAAAKRLLFGRVGIDFIAGPTDVLVIADSSGSVGLIAADLIAQAEHDPDARARALVPAGGLAEKITAAVEQRLNNLPTEKTARASLDTGGLVIVYETREDAIRIANTIAPEHLELQVGDADNWIPRLKNYGSLFIGSLSAEPLGDYSAGINHTLPTSGSARFSGGLSVRHFLKTVTTLRCAPGAGFEKARNAAETLARAEGLEGHAQSAGARGAFEDTKK
ncbi:MAG: histidinol dehydrogenase [Treponema sp.]|jgi:histidinol dehydrogenase|nr:histidinol dehydrogenase [Treponema sp.]